METRNCLITGTDAATIEVEARKVVRRETGDNPDPTALETFRERTGVEGPALLHEGIAALLSPPFFGPRKTVWLHYAPGFAAEGTTRGPKTAEAKAIRRLAEIIGAGLPPGVGLVLSGPDAAADGELAAACLRTGQVLAFRRPDVKDRNWQHDMLNLIRGRAQDKGLKLSKEAAFYLLEAIGTDTARLDPELEKLACYVGGSGATAALADVQEICQGEGEASTWTLLDALGARRADETLRQIQVLMTREKDPDSFALTLLRAIAGHFRNMLQLRVFLQDHRHVRSGEQLRSLVLGLSAEEKATALQQGFDVIGLHPFRLLMLTPQALQYSGAELVKALPKLRDAYWKCVSGAVSDNRVVLEDLVVQLASPKPA